MQITQPGEHVFLVRIDHGAGAKRHGALQPFRRQVERDHIRHAAIEQPQHHAETDRPAAEYNHFVARLRLRAIDPVQRDRERLGERTDLVGHLLRDRQDAVADPGVADQHLVGEGAVGTAAADEARRVHGIDHDPLAHRDVLHGGADGDHLTRGFMADRRRAAGLTVDPAPLDIAEIAAADAAGLYLHNDVGIARGRRSNLVHPHVVDTVNIENTPHVILL